MIPTIVQLPISSRYTKEWHDKLIEHPDFDVFAPTATHVIDRTKPYNYFTNLDEAVRYEARQIALLLENYDDGCIDTLLVTDLDFPGLTALSLPVLRLKYPQLRLFSILHAGSYCEGDIFAGDANKLKAERLAAASCDIVFVATDYHMAKLIHHGFEGNFRVLGGLPYYADDIQHHRRAPDNRPESIAVIGRPEQCSIELLEAFSHANLINGLPKQLYLQELARHKVAVIPKVEETFGYSVLDCIALGVIPIAPNGFAYPEILPGRYLFDTTRQALAMAAYYSTNAGSGLAALPSLDNYAALFDVVKQDIDRITTQGG